MPPRLERANDAPHFRRKRLGTAFALGVREASFRRPA